MATAKELKVLSANIGRATLAYHDAVKETLKESGKEHGVYGDEYADNDVEAVRVTTFNDNGDGVVFMDIDKVRYNKECDGVEIHVCMEDYRECDWWHNAYMLGEEVDCVFDAIKWEDD